MATANCGQDADCHGANRLGFLDEMFTVMVDIVGITPCNNQRCQDESRRPV